MAEDAKVLALGLADHEVTQEELDKGAPPVPRFNTPAIAYVSAANLKKGDTVEITLSNNDKPLLTNSETLAEDQSGLSAASGQAWRAGRRLAVGVDLFRQAQDHPRRQAADRAGDDADSVRIGSASAPNLCEGQERPSLDIPLVLTFGGAWNGRSELQYQRQGRR